MSWLSRHHLKLYITNSIWVLPVFSIFAGLLMVAVVNQIDRALGWKIDIKPDTARTVIGTVAGSMFTLVVVASSAVLVAVQLGSAQLTPRIILLVYRSRVRKFCVAAFVFTFTFSVGVLVRIDETVPVLSCYIAAYGFLFNLAILRLRQPHTGCLPPRCARSDGCVSVTRRKKKEKETGRKGDGEKRRPSPRLPVSSSPPLVRATLHCQNDSYPPRSSFLRSTLSWHRKIPATLLRKV